HAVKALAVLGQVDALGGGAENAHAVAVQALGQFYRRLPAKGHHHAHRLLAGDDAQNVLLRERLEVEAVGGVVVGGDGLRVVVDDDHFKAHAPQRAHAVDGGIVKLDALPDADRPAAQNDDHRLARALEAPGIAENIRGGV